MSVTGGVAGELFRITIVKYLTANPDRKWANNYEVKSLEEFTGGQLNALGLIIVDFEVAMHLTIVQFDRLRISTWEEDSVPYDPESFTSLPLAGAGTRAMASDQALALNVCLDVGRIPISGRFGHIYMRGVLKEADVGAPSGKFILADPAGMNTEISNALTSSTYSEYFEGTAGPFQTVMINKTGSNVREVLDLQRRGVAVVPFDHAWFNRTAPP